MVSRSLVKAPDALRDDLKLDLYMPWALACDSHSFPPSLHADRGQANALAACAHFV